MLEVSPERRWTLEQVVRSEWLSLDVEAPKWSQLVDEGAKRTTHERVQ